MKRIEDYERILDQLHTDLTRRCSELRGELDACYDQDPTAALTATESLTEVFRKLKTLKDRGETLRTGLEALREMDRLKNEVLEKVRELGPQYVRYREVREELGGTGDGELQELFHEADPDFHLDYGELEGAPIGPFQQLEPDVFGSFCEAPPALQPAAPPAAPAVQPEVFAEVPVEPEAPALPPEHTGVAPETVAAVAAVAAGAGLAAMAAPEEAPAPAPEEPFSLSQSFEAEAGPAPIPEPPPPAPAATLEAPEIPTYPEPPPAPEFSPETAPQAETVAPEFAPEPTFSPEVAPASEATPAAEAPSLDPALFQDEAPGALPEMPEPPVLVETAAAPEIEAFVESAPQPAPEIPLEDPAPGIELPPPPERPPETPLEMPPVPDAVPEAAAEFQAPVPEAPPVPEPPAFPEPPPAPEFSPVATPVPEVPAYPEPPSEFSPVETPVPDAAPFPAPPEDLPLSEPPAFPEPPVPEFAPAEVELPEPPPVPEAPPVPDLPPPPPPPPPGPELDGVDDAAALSALLDEPLLDEEEGHLEDPTGGMAAVAAPEGGGLLDVLTPEPEPVHIETPDHGLDPDPVDTMRDVFGEPEETSAEAASLLSEFDDDDLDDDLGVPMPGTTPEVPASVGEVAGDAAASLLAELDDEEDDPFAGLDLDPDINSVIISDDPLDDF